MKFIQIICFVFLSSQLTFGQCTQFFPMQKNATWEQTSYDKKDKKQSKVAYTVAKVAGNSADISGTVYDKKDKPVSDMDFTVKCENGTFYVDMSSVIPQQQLEAFKSMEMDVETSYLEFPGKLSVGQKLPDGTITITVSSGGVQIMKMTVIVRNRKVAGKEEVTTPAGTFMCYKITEETYVDMSMAKVTTKSINWIAENVGTVKTESYDDKDRYQGKTILTAYSGS